MPLYEFQCNKCNRKFTSFTKIGAKPKPCVKCGGKVIRLISSGVGVIFKGDGWPGQDIKRRKK